MSNDYNPINPARTVNDLSPRDLNVLRYVARFKQLTAKQIRTLTFANASTTPSDRSLKRLTDMSYLRRIERRLVGGSKGGSGQYVYELGRRGFYMFATGPYRPSRNISFHTLAIADTFIMLREMEGAGSIKLDGLSTEPDCWLRVGGVEIRPDMRCHFTTSTLRQYKLWVEVDMGTEAQRQLRGKLEAYLRAFANFSEADADWPVFPLVVWVAVDVERERELRWLIGQYPPDRAQLFRVCTIETLPSAL